MKKLDPNLLMWDIRRNIDPAPLPKRRTVIQIMFSDLSPAQKNWWPIVESGQGTDLCSVDPGFDVDLYLATDLKTMTEIWMGYTTIARAKSSGKLAITGNRDLASKIGKWFCLSSFAGVERRVA